ncbi:hypothetical protein PsYK624_105800 [Phanerochaete sordida]|uniref:Uncharacterized protein n=1 Tax=Phanerochaete sordida TaxID=48140 RepID=A0A9P3GGK6_9APHY|nr:hypothetical protein PsYK624_105800 [Phanerochaete sordida]
MLLSAENQSYLDSYRPPSDEDLEWMHAVGIPLPLSLQARLKAIPKAPSTPKPRSEAMKRFIARHGVKKLHKEAREHKGTSAQAVDGVPVRENDVDENAKPVAQPDNTETPSTSGILENSPVSNAEHDPTIAEMQLDDAGENRASPVPDTTQASPSSDTQKLSSVHPATAAAHVQEDEHSACELSMDVGVPMEVDAAQNDSVHEAALLENAMPCDTPSAAEDPVPPSLSCVLEQNAGPSTVPHRPSATPAPRAPTPSRVAPHSPSLSSPSSSSSIPRVPTPPWGNHRTPTLPADTAPSDPSEEPSEPSPAVLAACFVAAEARIARVLAPARRGQPPWGAATVCGAGWLEATGRRYRATRRRELLGGADAGAVAA